MVDCLQQSALLRVKVDGFSRSNGEKRCVEGSHIVLQVMGMSDVDLWTRSVVSFLWGALTLTYSSISLMVGVIEGIGIVTILGRLLESRTALEEEVVEGFRGVGITRKLQAQPNDGNVLFCVVNLRHDGGRRNVILVTVISYMWH